MAWMEATTRCASRLKAFAKRALPFVWLPLLVLAVPSCDWFAVAPERTDMPLVSTATRRAEVQLTSPLSSQPSQSSSVEMFTPPLTSPTQSVRGAYCFDTAPTSVPAQYYTHVYHAFLRSDNNGRLLLNAPNDRAGTMTFSRAAKLFVPHVQRAGAYAMLSLGGGMDKSFHAFVGKTAKRRAYVGAVLGVVQHYGYDGVDLDWEQPRTPAEQRHWATLMSEMRAGLDAMGRKNGKRYWLTAAVGVSKWSASYFDIPTIRSKLDFINLMAYDYIGPWGGDPAGDQAALETQSFGGHSTRKGLAFWRARGIKPSQIVIGVPFYTRVCFGYKPGQIIQKNSPTGKRTMAFGYDSFLAYAAQNHWTMRLDPKTKVRWYTSPRGKHFAAVDGPESIAHKTRFAEANGYRGVFCWATYHNPSGELQQAMARPQRRQN